MAPSTATGDWLGRTPEEIARDREQAQLTRERILGRDWHEVPRGYYAVPIESLDYDPDPEDDWDPPVIGYQLYERKVSRVGRNGQRIGRNAFIHGRVMVAPGADSQDVSDSIQIEREAAVKAWGPGADLKETIDRIMLDVEGNDTFRTPYGKLTGRCGSCGKSLTDPRSKLVGLGPDCRGDRRPAPDLLAVSGKKPGHN